MMYIQRNGLRPLTWDIYASRRTFDFTKNMKFINNISKFLYDILIHRADIDSEERARRAIFIILNSIVIPFITFFGYVKLKEGEYTFGISDLLLCVLMISSIIRLRYVKQGKWYFRLALFVMSSLAIYWVYTGVNEGGSSLWYFVIPSVAFFLFGKREGLAWAASTLIVSVGVFVYIRLSGTGYQYPVPFMIRHALVQLLLILLTFGYETARSKYKQGLEERQKKLECERNSLDEANTMLKAEIEERERIEEELHSHKEHLEDLVAQRTGELSKSLREKEVLLKELYHRTKNNMQVISGILNLTASKEGNEGFADIFRDVEMKIKSMALVHQKLYESMDLTHIDIGDYVNALSSYALEILKVPGGDVSFEFTGEPISLSVDTAIPFGLVLNELISNSLKHAFHGRRDNVIELDIAGSDGGIVVHYRDNGAGLQSGIDRSAPPGVGMLIMRNIIELQLGGSLTIMESDGFSCEIFFQTDRYRNRV